MCFGVAHSIWFLFLVVRSIWETKNVNRKLHIYVVFSVSISHVYLFVSGYLSSWYCCFFLELLFVMAAYDLIVFILTWQCLLSHICGQVRWQWYFQVEICDWWSYIQLLWFLGLHCLRDCLLWFVQCNCVIVLCRVFDFYFWSLRVFASLLLFIDSCVFT